MNLRDPLVVYRRFRSAEMNETQSLLLAEMFSDPKAFLEDCKSSLVLFRKLRDVGFMEEASLVLGRDLLVGDRGSLPDRERTALSVFPPKELIFNDKDSTA